MPLHALHKNLWFPDVEDALPDGLLAAGGDLSPERLLLAYRNGIFPWFEGDIPLWWCPDPRFVLFPQDLKVSKSMKILLNRNVFSFTVNTAFVQVIEACKRKERKDQEGTWITDEVEAAYVNMHSLGHAHSAEAWLNNQLVGGLYGIRLGKVFFGESMFSNESNASKYAFISYISTLQSEGVSLIDCQVFTGHLHTLGAKMISRNEFIRYLDELI